MSAFSSYQDLTFMPQPTPPPILITGSVRSGSTWVGKMLAASPTIGYISEPFNPLLNYYGMEHPQFYTYLTDAKGEDYMPWVQDLLRFRMRKWISRKLPEQLYHRITQPRPLLKDPVAALASDWLARHFDMQVVVILRHPAAVVASLRRLGWVVAPNTWSQQPHLLDDWLSEYAEPLTQPNLPHLERNAYSWLAVYTVLHGFIQQHPDWIVVRHEDLAHAPLAAFRDLYERLHIPFTPSVAAHIEQHSKAKNPVAAPDNAATALKRDSRALVGAWADKFTADELQTIHTITAPIADLYYPEAW